MFGSLPSGLSCLSQFRGLCLWIGKAFHQRRFAYDLRTDTFLKTRLEGSFPRPRFLLEDKGYLLFHGGYWTQLGNTPHEFAVLDLAPAMQRPFDWLPVRTSNFAGHEPVACDDV